MSRKNGLQIKKEIIKKLKNKEMSLRELETKLNTNYQTIRTHIKELEYFGLVEIIKHEKNKQNGRPYTSVKITPKGQLL
jgi:predicted ArsR family transcriptional regulator